jgi:hypothetical protein
MLEIVYKFIIEKLYHSKNFTIHKLGVFILSLNQQRKLGFKRIKRKRPKVHVLANNRIPQLSWICDIVGDNYNFTVGSAVEISERFIFEGTWDGDFNSGKIRESEFAFGSGAVIDRNRITFIPPKHTLEGLYILVDKKRKRTGVSNSLCFLTKMMNVGLNGDFFKKLSQALNNAINVASERGIDTYTQRVVETKEYILYRMLFYNFSVNSLGTIKLQLILPRLYFNSFNSYTEFLKEKIKKIVENSTSPYRKITYHPISTLTKGYDSPTVSLLAKGSGCNEALTLDVVIMGIDDSGTEIGKVIGFNVYSYKHIMAQYSDNDSMVENLRVEFENELQHIASEFIATGGVGDDVAFYPFQDKLRKRLFLTGSLGDSVWNKQTKLRPGIPSAVPFMKSITEYRLRVGFLFFPVPYLGGRFPAAIVRISNSDELRRYSNGSDYDRPICRRIIEEAGIPGDWFGVRKNATAPLILNHKKLFPESFKQTMNRY